MIQLWLGGKRIDSIPMLRDEFALRDENGKLEFCMELLKKVTDGFFIEWLEQCTETRRRSNQNEREHDASIGILLLDTCQEELSSNADETNLSDNTKRAIAEICNIDINIIERSSIQTENRISRKELVEQLEGEKWYHEDEEIRRTINGIPLDRLAVDTESLSFILHNATKYSQRYFADLYLLNTGNVFTIREIKSICNIRLVGFGNPIVHFSPRLRNEKLDMKAQNLFFEGLYLMSHGVKLINQQKRLNNVIQP